MHLLLKDTFDDIEVNNISLKISDSLGDLTKSPTNNSSSHLIEKNQKRQIEGPILVLRGHRSEIISCCVNSNPGIVVSCSHSSDVLLHSIRRGRLIRRLDGVEAHIVCLSSEGVVMTWNESQHTLSTFTLNGTPITRAQFSFFCSISCMQISVDGTSALIGVNSLENDLPSPLIGGRAGYRNFNSKPGEKEDSSTFPNHKVLLSQIQSLKAAIYAIEPVMPEDALVGAWRKSAHNIWIKRLRRTSTLVELLQVLADFVGAINKGWLFQCKFPDGVIEETVTSFASIPHTSSALALWLVKLDAIIDPYLDGVQTQKKQGIGKQDYVDRESINDGGDSSVSNKWEVLMHFGEIQRQNKDRVATVQFNKSGNLLACHVAGKTVEIFRVLYDAEAKRKAKRMVNRKKEKKHGETKRTLGIDLQGHRSDVRSVTLSSDITFLLSTSHNAVKIGNPSTGSCLRTIDSGYGLCSLILPSNKYGLVRTKDGRLEIIDIGSGTRVEVIEAHGGPVRTIVVLPDRFGFVTGSADHEVKFWDYRIKQKPGQPTKQLTVSNVKTMRMNDDVLVVAISPDAKYIVVALLDSTT
ncbi:uncharacterized protein LOC127103896 [Lathyrus oleraceus]|uniref:uncharacterized protein LOC127103896 n=1 Tax=Pisum sativum TaxID=3888 RepID=UPI0021CF03C7|nr:uncharacterized protein LOC127103896 [Pisum sativum]